MFRQECVFAVVVIVVEALDGSGSKVRSFKPQCLDFHSRVYTHTQKKNSLLCANNAIFMNYQSFKTKELISSIVLAKMFDSFFPKFLPGKQKINPNKSSSLNYLNNVVHS